jgi:hypothetical protein
MKKIIAAAALVVTGIGLAAPAYGATSAAPSSAQTVQSSLAVGLGHGPQQRAAAGLESGVYVIHSAGSAPGSALGIGPVPLVYPPIDVPVRYFDGGGFVQRWIVQAIGDGRYTITAVPGAPDSYSLTPRGYDVFVSARTRPVAQWLIQPAGEGTWTIAAPDGDDTVITLQRDEFPPLVLAPQDGSADQLWNFTRLDG